MYRGEECTKLDEASSHGVLINQVKTVKDNWGVCLLQGADTGP
jgi:hypothetical protein